MSSPEPASSQPRRSQRDKRQSQPFLSSSQQLKRKRSDDTDDEGLTGVGAEHHDEPSDDEEAQEEEEEEGEAYVAPKKTQGAAGGAKRGRPKAATTKAKAPKAATTKGAGGVRGRRKPRGGAEYDADAVAKETRLNSDNALFNAIMNPSTALKLTAEEFMDSLANDPNGALADLVNCMFRACGCNESVSPDVAVDEDGVVDRLDEITEVLKQDDSPIYPLTSKLPMFKKFRKSLAEFLHRLVAASAETGLMYSTVFIDVFKHWVAAMSSSQLRSFRHTATVLALEVETALCDVAAAVDKEASTTERQLEAEKKKKGGQKRVKELEAKADDIRDRSSMLTDTLKALTDGVFVNRYRDLDPAIRAECIHALGQWFAKYPSYFILEGNYLRYVGWTLSDGHNPVRLESVRALGSIYVEGDHVASLQAFTERFKARFVEMAQRDTDLSVRVSMIQVLAAIDGHELLDDEEREELCLLAYDPELRVRKAVSGFVQGVWADIVKERLAGRKASQQETSRAGVKALGTLLVRLSKALEKKAAEEDEEEEDTTDEMGMLRVGHLMAIANGQSKGRVAFAVEALWEDVESVRDWEALLDVLLLDHSAQEESAGRKRKGKKSEASVDEAWRLEEVEEATLLEVLVTSLSKARADAVGSTKKNEGETVVSDITRALIKGLPALFAKHQADEKRIAQVLLIPPLMNFDLYLEMRMMTAYEALWDDIIKQYTSHSSPPILTNSISSILTLLSTTSLSAINTTKLTELSDELASSLRELVAGREELAITSLNEDEVGHLSAICSRIAELVRKRDMGGWMEEDEGGKQSSVFDILGALAERGKLGYREEETMVQQCLTTLTVHFMWKSRALPPEPEDDNTPLHDAYIESRSTLIKKLVEFTVGTQSNTSEEVQRVAFKQLMHIHVLFSAPQDPLLALKLDDEVQYRCAGYVEAEIERFAEEVEELTDVEEEEEEESGDEDTQTIKKRKRAANGKAKAHADGATPQRTALERQLLFNDLLNAFARAILTRAIHPKHGKPIFVHYGRLGKMCDLSSARALMEFVRDCGLYEGQGEMVVGLVVESLRDAFKLHLEGLVSDESHSVALSKLLVGTLLKRGAHLSIERKLPAEHIVSIHTQLLTWIIKQIGGHEANKNKKARNSGILFFRVLQVLCGAVDERDALRIKAHMDQELAKAKLQVSPTSPVWEPQRAYERRLNNIMTKSKGGAGRGKKAKTAANPTTTDDEQSGQSEAELEAEVASAPKPRPRARAVRNARARQPSAAPSEPDEEPQPRTPARPTRKNPSPRKAAASSPNKTPQRRSSRAPSEAMDEDREATPKASTSTARKRAREEEEEEEEEMADDVVVPSSPVSNGVVVPPSPASSQASLRITRKRARR